MAKGGSVKGKKDLISDSRQKDTKTAKRTAATKKKAKSKK